MTPEQQKDNLIGKLNETRSVLRPPEHMNLSEWAEQYYMVTDGAFPGRFRLSTAPYQQEILDTLGNDTHTRVVLNCASQLAKSISLMVFTAYCIDRDPCPILVVQPTKSMADAFASERIEPMLLNNPQIAHHFENQSKRDGGSTKRLKMFPGGYIAIANAGSVSELASRAVRVILADEVDRFDNTREGDAISLAEKRTSTFWNSKIVLVSTPTDEYSRIAKEYQESDRRIYECPCPYCGSYQSLRWEQVKWENDKEKPLYERIRTASYQCEHCNIGWNEADRLKAISNGKWVKTNPDHPTAGFHLNAIASPFLPLSKLVEEHYEALEEVEKRRTFVNTRLAEVFKDQSTSINPQTLFGRVEKYTDDCIPNQIGLITAGVDVQEDRLEVEVVGWGRGDESWNLDYERFHGSTQTDAPYDQLKELLQKKYTREDGVQMTINATCIDAGGEDAATQQTFTFAYKNRAMNILPIKGMPGKGKLIFKGEKRKWRNKKYGSFYPVGTDEAKKRHFDFMAKEAPGPGFMHFPEGRDGEYFEGLASESRVEKRERGKTTVKWVKKPNVRNEPLDARIYAMAARFSFNVDIGSRAEKLENDAEKIEERQKKHEADIKQKEAAESMTPEEKAHRERQRRVVERHKQKTSRPGRAGWMKR